jgi:hypothetical protein
VNDMIYVMIIATSKKQVEGRHMNVLRTRYPPTWQLLARQISIKEMGEIPSQGNAFWGRVETGSGAFCN